MMGKQEKIKRRVFLTSCNVFMYICVSETDFYLFIFYVHHRYVTVTVDPQKLNNHIHDSVCDL